MKEEEILRIGVRGRVTIPKSLREKYGINHLDKYKVHVISDVMIFEKVNNLKGADKTMPLETYMK